MPEHARRILIVIASLGGGGAERVVVDLCASLVEAGREVTLLTLHGNDPDAYDLPANVHRERMEIRYSPYFPGHTWVFVGVNLLRLRNFVRRSKPDVVLSFLDQTNICVIACLRGMKIPIVIAERTSPARHHLRRFWRTMRKLTYPYADALVVQTNEAADWFRRLVPDDRIVVIPNAVRAPTEFRPAAAPPEGPAAATVLAVGRLKRVKGFDLLLEAFAQSGLSDAGWRLVILGEGEERARLVEQARALGITRLEMPGHVRNVSDWMTKAAIFALTSRYEGFPNALIEAMQSGRACVSFDCQNGPRDIIDHGRNGILVKPEDVADLAKALRCLAHDLSLRERLSQAALDVNIRFSRREIYSLWHETLDRVQRRT